MIHRRSLETFGVSNMSYLGDGDLSAFSTIKAEKPYGDQVKLVKFECLGHVKHSAATTMYFRRVLKKVKMSISAAKF